MSTAAAHSAPASDRASAPASGRELAGWTLLVFGVALAVRAVVLWELSSEAIFELRMGDGRVYHLWALELAAGNWLGDQTFYQAPLYPYFLGAIYRIAGDSMTITRLVQIVIGATGCALLAQAGWRLFSKPAGLIAGALLAVYPPAVFADVMIQKSVLDIFFVCVVVAILAEMIIRRAPLLRSSAALGVVLGALVLTRENTLVFLPVLLPWLLLLPQPDRRRRLALAGVFVAGLVAVLLPVAVRNLVVGGELHLTTSQFGHNFYIGNNPNADGTYAPLVYARGDPLVERDDAVLLVERAIGRTPTPAEVSSFYTERALDYITSQPLDWTVLLGRKLLLALNAVELVDTEDIYAYARHAWMLWLPGRVLHFGVLVPLAFLGAWITWPERRRIWPLYALAGVYLASLLLFYIFARYRLPIVPIAALLAGAGLAGLPGRLREAAGSGAWKGVAVGLAGTAVVAVVANWPLLDERYMRSVTYYNFGNELVRLKQEPLGIAYYEQAIEMYPDNAVANHNLGVVLARRGSYGVAREHFEEALRIEPDYVEAHFNLARVLADSYQQDAAIEAYRRGLALDPSRVDIHVELGRLLWRAGDREAARAALARALSIDASHAGARQALAEMAEEAREGS